MTINEEEKRITKDERVKKIFAETAMEMIKENGIESVSVRKVAEAAAYSMGTLYNHFENLDELLWYTKRFFIEEISTYIDNRSSSYGEITLRTIFRAYIDYFVENGNVFKFLFFTTLDKAKRADFNLNQVMRVDKQTRETFENYMTKSQCTPEQLQASLKNMLYSIHGMLMIYVTNNEELTKQQLYIDYDSIVDSILH
jgi:AcrR family transcriptional regulator